jgi:anti-anti-sigma regulatory factor
MSIRFETDASGRRALVCVSDDPRSAAALAELLPALRWTGIDEIVIDVSELDAIDPRIAVVLAQAKRHHESLGRKVSIVCRHGADPRGLQRDQADISRRIAAAKSSMSRSVVSNEAIQRTSPVEESHV